MTEDEQADAERGLATIADTLPPHWFRMYSNLQQEGFDKNEAMKILTTYISTMNNGRNH